MRKLANNSQRFFAYFIDFTIISFVVSMITSTVFAIMNFDVTMKEQIIKKVVEEIYVVVETGYIDNFMYYNIELLKYLMVELVVLIGCAALVFVGYLVILPHYWDKQTVGRMLSKTKVLMLDDKKLTIKAIILREFVGSFLLYYCLGTIPLLISVLMLNKEQRSLVDRISGTKLIYDVEVVQQYNQESKNDYIDAKFVDAEELDDDFKSNNQEPEADEDGYIVF